MGDQTLRVWPIEGDTYGDVQEFPRYAKYRMEPQYPSAAGDANHDLVIYTVDDSVDQPVGQPRNETELARFHATTRKSSKRPTRTPGPRPPTP
jgi:hypothetical protein